MLPASSHIANYRILRVLGEGGMGTVYEGMHDGIGRRVAIKVLHAEFARKPELVKPSTTSADRLRGAIGNCRF